MNFTKRKAAALAATLGIVAFPAMARADLIVRASTDGGATFTTICDLPSGSLCTFNKLVLGSFTITGSANSNSPGSPTLSQLLSSTLSIQNGGAAVANIILQASDNNFAAPTSGTFASHIGGTVVTGGPANLLTFQSCLDGTNTNFGCATATPGPQASSPIVSPGSFVSDASIPVVATPEPYAMTEMADLTLSSGSEINYSTSTTLSTAPEPATLTLVATGLLGMVGTVRRRKKNLAV